MKTDYDIFKSAKNIRERELPFEYATNLVWEMADIRVDERIDYGETRYVGVMPNEEGRLFNVVFTIRDETVRIISLRKANRKEVKRYEAPDR